MKTESIEVKTHYSIRFNFHDFVKIFSEAEKDPVRLHAFDNFDLTNTTMGNLRDCYKSLGELSIFLSTEEVKQQCENLRYIVRKLGFDEVDNYGGFYGRDKDEYHISVYNRGADI